MNEPRDPPTPKMIKVQKSKVVLMKFDTMTSFKIDLQKMIHLTKLGYELGVAHFEGNFKENRYVER